MLEHVIAEDLGIVLRAQPELWEQFRNKSIFLTGGTGFFGSWLLYALRHLDAHLDLNLKVAVLSRAPDQFMARFPQLAQYRAFAFVAGDVRDFSFPTGSFDYVIHAATAASAALNRESPLVMLDTIVQGTRRVLDFARACQAQRLLFISSGAVYGNQPDTMTHIDETYLGQIDPLTSKDAYGIGKFFAESLCAAYARLYGITIPIARCFAFLGPFLPLDSHFAAGNFIRNALGGETIHVSGDGTACRSYMYPTDLVEWIFVMLLQGVSCRAYNVGSDNSVTIRELAEKIAACAGHLPVHIAQQADPSRKPHRYVPSIERSRHEFGLKIRIDLHESITRTLAANGYRV